MKVYLRYVFCTLLLFSHLFVHAREEKKILFEYKPSAGIKNYYFEADATSGEPSSQIYHYQEHPYSRSPGLFTRFSEIQVYQFEDDGAIFLTFKFQNDPDSFSRFRDSDAITFQYPSEEKSKLLQGMDDLKMALRMTSLDFVIIRENPDPVRFNPSKFSLYFISNKELLHFPSSYLDAIIIPNSEDPKYAEAQALVDRLQNNYYLFESVGTFVRPPVEAPIKKTDESPLPNEDAGYMHWFFSIFN